MEQSEPARPEDDSTYREQLDEGYMRRRASFDEAADTCDGVRDGARPDYPEQLFDYPYARSPL